jgi:hypothetical protein
MSRFQPHWYQNWIFWLLFTVKSGSTLVPIFSFAVLLVDWACPLAMVSIDMLGFQFISVVSPFAWCHLFVAQTWNFHFPSLAMCVCMVVWPTINSLCMFELSIKPLHQDALDGRVLSLELWIASCWICIFYADVGLSSLNPILFPLIWNLVDLPLSEPSIVICRYSAFLLNSLKVDGIASLDLLAPSHVHYDCTTS